MAEFAGLLSASPAVSMDALPVSLRACAGVGRSSQDSCSDSPVVLDVRVVVGAGGGPEKTILNSPRFLVKRGYRMLCAYLRKADDSAFDLLRRRAASNDAPLLEIDDGGPFDCSVVRKLAEICRKERVAIWHGHEYKSNVLGILVQQLWPMRLITTLHGWVERTARTRLYYLVDRVSLRFYDHVVGVSADLHYLARMSGVSPQRCSLLENGIDTERYARATPRARAKARLGLDPGKLLVGAAGRLSPEKGFDRLILAADMLWRQGRDFSLVILGTGAQRTELAALVERLGRSDRVHLAGYASDMIPWYEAMDVFALSSVREGLPNVLLEAMAMDVPAVATRVAGVPRLIQDGSNGVLVPVDDVGALARGLAKLIADDGMRSALGAGARRTVESQYSFARRMEKLADIYDKLLNRRTRVCPGTIV